MISEKERQLFEDRINKLNKIRDGGTDPYPAKSLRDHTIGSLLEDFAKISQEEKTVTVIGRIRALRGHGKLVFGDLEDASGKIQFAVKADVVGKYFKLFENFDIGDFLQVSGKLFVTQKGEKTIQVNLFLLLSKSLRALPEKFHGLKDIETRLRQRYLDLLADPDARELFQKKSRFWQSIRNFLSAAGFLEVETPVLENIPGGAEAEPFITHHNALNRDFYLRISLELPLKRLLVGGYEKVFEIGRIFRNEGIDAEHLQDYTAMEFYWAFADYNDLQNFLPQMYQDAIKNTFGSLSITSRGTTVDWGKKWKTYDYYNLFQEHAGIDLSKANEQNLKDRAKKLGLKAEKFVGKGRLIDLIYKKTVRPLLIEPGFLINPPVEIEPLAKRLPNDPSRVQRLQVVAYGTELGKGFSELNDPQDQRNRFEEQMKLRAAGDKEAQRIDEDYLEALEYGMPPAAGFGLSDRLFSVLADKPIRETVIFPPMRAEK